MLHFMLDPGPNPFRQPEPDSEPEPECISFPVPLGRNVAVPAIPVLAPVPQHWLDHSLGSFCFLLNIRGSVSSVR